MNDSRIRLLAALLLSAAAHGAILAALPGAQPTRPERGGSGPLTVALVETEAEPLPRGSTAPRSAELRRASPTERASTNQRQGRPTHQIAPPRPKTRDVNSKPPKKKTHSAGSPRGAMAREEPTSEETAESAPTPAARGKPDHSESKGNRVLRGQLKDALAWHFYYPPQALRRGWEGRVLLELEVAPDGKVEVAAVIASSGHALLDRAALDAANRIGRLPDAPRWLHGTARRLQLPVIYRLKEG